MKKSLFFSIILIVGILFSACQDEINCPVSPGKDFREYSARIYQSGTDAPILQPIKDELGFEIYSCRYTAGSYCLSIKKPNEFPARKTIIDFENGEGGNAYARLDPDDRYTIQIWSKDSKGNYSDNIIGSGFITIKIYN